MRCGGDVQLRTPLRWTTSMITTAGILTPDRGQRGPHASMAGYRLPNNGFVVLFREVGEFDPEL